MRILIGQPGNLDSELLGALPEASITFHAETAAEVLESVCACLPDILIVHSGMPDLGTTLQQVHHLLPVPVLVLGEDDDTSAMLPVTDTDIFGYLASPVNPVALRRMVAVAVEQFQRLQQACTEARQLREAFALRKTVERAKGLMMQRQRMSEAEAYAYLRDESRRRRIPMAEFAQSLIGEGEDDAMVRKVRKVAATR